MKWSRSATITRRGALDELKREANARTRRMQEITKEESGWKLRLEQAGTRAAELTARRQQYEYYRNKLLTFEERKEVANA